MVTAPLSPNNWRLEVQSTFLHFKEPQEGGQLWRSSSEPVLLRAMNTDLMPSLPASPATEATHLPKESALLRLPPFLENCLVGHYSGRLPDHQFWRTGCEQEDCSRDDAGCEKVYTVMMKNIPCGCSRQEVLDAIENSGFRDKFDFFHLPLKRRAGNIGYAFIGFPDPEVTRRFTDAMTGFRFPGRQSAKVVAVVPARIQGKSDNLKHFMRTKVMTTHASPIFKADSQELPGGLVANPERSG